MRVGHDARFRTAQVHSALGLVSRWAGLPLGIQLPSDFFVQHLQFYRAADLPVTGTSWTITEQGVATQALSDDLFPPHVILTNAALDNDSQELQWTAADASGEYIDLTDGRRHYFEFMVRFRDANNDDDTVEQLDFFVGFCVTDTTVIDGATDFIGFVKQDLDTDALQRIQVVSADAGGAAGALVDGFTAPTSWTTLNPGAVTPDTTAGRRAARILGPNEWIKLGLLIQPNATGAQGNAFAFINGRPVSGPHNLAGEIPDQNLCLTLGFQNGEAVAKIMDVASILVAAEYEAGTAENPNAVAGAAGDIG